MGLFEKLFIIFKMKVLVECSTTTFPYDSWRLKSINANNYISPLVFTALFHRFIQIIYNNNISKLWRRQAGLNRRPLQPLL